MESARKFVPVRNTLVCFGIYYLSGWLGFLFSIVYIKLVNHVVYDGDFGAAVVLPLVERFPRALSAAVAGVAVFCFVESDQPVLWSLLPAAMYAALGFTGYQWARPPLPADRIGQAVGAFYPAATCVLGAILAKRLERKPHLVAEN